MKVSLILVIVAACASGCSRDVALCDGEALARKARVAVEQCQARGYDWLECPERERILSELAKELGQCSSR